MLFSKEKAELLEKIQGLEAENKTLKGSVETLEGRVTTMQTEHELALKAKDDEVTVKVNQAVQDALASAGVPEGTLPSAKQQSSGGGTSAYAQAVEHYHSIEDAKARADYYAATIAPMFARKN